MRISDWSSDVCSSDLDAQDAQTLSLRYPTVTPIDAYVGKAVKIESGAKSALDPHALHTITPYLEADVPGINLAVANVTIVDAERTVWRSEERRVGKEGVITGRSRWWTFN